MFVKSAIESFVFGSLSLVTPVKKYKDSCSYAKPAPLSPS